MEANKGAVGEETKMIMAVVNNKGDTRVEKRNLDLNAIIAMNMKAVEGEENLKVARAGGISKAVVVGVNLKVVEAERNLRVEEVEVMVNMADDQKGDRMSMDPAAEAEAEVMVNMADKMITVQAIMVEVEISHKEETMVEVETSRKEETMALAVDMEEMMI